MTKRLELDIKLHKEQWAAFNSNKQFIAVVAGVQSGKTFLGSVWTQKKVSEFPDKNGLIAAPSYKILNQSTLEKFFNLFPFYRNFYKQHKGVIELPKGGNIFIRSADEPLGLEGMTLNWAWLDEAGMMRKLVWQVIRSRVSITSGQVLITTTPYALNWLYHDFFLKWKNHEDEDLDFYTWKSINNPFFNKEFYDKEKSRLSEQEFARRYEGEFTKITGLVYELKENNIIEPTKIVIPDKVIAGVDWGYRNPSAISVIIIKGGIYFIVDEFYETEKTTSEVIHKAKIFQEKYNVNAWYPDPAEPDRVEEMRRAGLYVMETNKNLKYGISKIQQLIRENRLFVFSTCQNTLEEFNYYRYDEDKASDEPIKENDHLLDAIRYAIIGNNPLDNKKIEHFRIQARNFYKTKNIYE